MNFRLIIGSLIISCVFGTSLSKLHAYSATETKANSSVENLPLDELATLTDAYVQIKKSYVKQLSDQQILDNAIKGMLSNLDQHSRYYDQDAFSEQEESARGEYAGIGIRAEHLAEGILVRYIFEQSPAEKSGLQLNDNIIAIDGQSTLGLSTEAGSELMRGEPDTKLTLTVISEQKKQKTIKLSRKIIQFSTVNQQLLEKNIGYARIGEFQVRSARDLSLAITQLEQENKAPLNGLILDLRNNPGGILDAAVAVSDLFLHKGTIVTIKGRDADSNQQYSATSGDILAGKPMALLINQNSASASEIVAGALQDLKRATIIGNQSYGKGSVQTLFPIHGGGAIKMTTSLYYTPANRSIQDSGISPDVTISFEMNPDEAKEVVKGKEYQLDNQVMKAVELLQQPQKH